MPLEGAAAKVLFPLRCYAVGRGRMGSWNAGAREVVAVNVLVVFD